MLLVGFLFVNADPFSFKLGHQLLVLLIWPVFWLWILWLTLSSMEIVNTLAVIFIDLKIDSVFGCCCWYWKHLGWYAAVAGLVKGWWQFSCTVYGTLELLHILNLH